MILFFYGPNDYLISRKVRELKDKYLQKAGGDLNLVTLNGSSLKSEDFSRQIMAMPLLSTSRLIIVEGILKNKDKKLQEEVKNLIPKVSSSTILLFIEIGSPDRRLGLFKALNKPKVAQEFKMIEPYRLSQFIKGEVKDRRAVIDDDAAELIGEFVGDNLWRLSSEIEKLISFANGQIRRSDVEELVEQNVTTNIFSLIDDLSHSNKASALKHLSALLKSGEPPLRILSLINYQYRTITQVKEALEKSDNQFAIVKITSLSPFQVSKSISLARKFTFQRLSEIYSEIARVDEEIKTGKIEDSEGLKDLILAV